MYKTKKDILLDCPELELTEFGDFKIKDNYIKDYEIIDFHCHLFKGLQNLFPKFLRREINDMKGSFFDKSCYPFSLKLFDMNQTTFTRYPSSIDSIDGIRTKYKLIAGGFILRNASVKRLLRDMKLNGIEKSVVMQINPPNINSGDEMEEIVRNNESIMTFGSIHPLDSDVRGKVDKYLGLDIKGWKINPHVGGFNIDSRETIDLIKTLAETNMPILSCSGFGVPEDFFSTTVLTKKQKFEIDTQRIKQFYQVLRINPNTTFILAHGGCFETDELIELMKKFPNTYTDISIQPSNNIKKLIDKIGSERILFGTDYPFVNHAISIVSVLRATSDEEQIKNIFSRNARRILKL